MSFTLFGFAKICTSSHVTMKNLFKLFKFKKKKLNNNTDFFMSTHKVCAREYNHLSTNSDSKLNKEFEM